MYSFCIEYKFRKLCCHHQVLHLFSVTETRWPPSIFSDMKEPFADNYCDCRIIPLMVVSYSYIKQNINASKKTVTWVFFELISKIPSIIELDLTNCMVSLFQNTNVDDGGGFISDLPLLKREYQLLSFWLLKNIYLWISCWPIQNNQRNLCCKLETCTKWKTMESFV